jgi:hypothetical protein
MANFRRRVERFGMFAIAVFMHGQLAINSAQFDVNGSETELGQQVSREFDTLWQIGREVELG